MYDNDIFLLFLDDDLFWTEDEDDVEILQSQPVRPLCR